MRSTHTARSSSLTEEISPFAVAVLRPFLPFLVSLYFAFQLPRGMEETAVESNGGKKAGVSGKARGQKIAAHVTTISPLVTGKVKQ